MFLANSVHQTSRRSSFLRFGVHPKSPEFRKGSQQNYNPAAYKCKSNDPICQTLATRSQKQNRGQYLYYSAPAVKEKDKFTPYFYLLRVPRGEAAAPALSPLIAERRPLKREGMDFGFTAGHMAGPLEEGTLLDGKGGGIHITDQFAH